jgi:hypothetical protein
MVKAKRLGSGLSSQLLSESAFTFSGDALTATCDSKFWGRLAIRRRLFRKGGLELVLVQRKNGELARSVNEYNAIFGAASLHCQRNDGPNGHC